MRFGSAERGYGVFEHGTCEVNGALYGQRFVLHEDCYEVIFALVGLVDLVGAYVLRMHN